MVSVKCFLSHVTEGLAFGSEQPIEKEKRKITAVARQIGKLFCAVTRN